MKKLAFTAFALSALCSSLAHAAPDNASYTLTGSVVEGACDIQINGMDAHTRNLAALDLSDLHPTTGITQILGQPEKVTVACASQRISPAIKISSTNQYTLNEHTTQTKIGTWVLGLGNATSDKEPKVRLLSTTAYNSDKTIWTAGSNGFLELDEPGSITHVLIGKASSLDAATGQNFAFDLIPNFTLIGSDAIKAITNTGGMWGFSDTAQFTLNYF